VSGALQYVEDVQCWAETLDPIESRIINTIANQRERFKPISKLPEIK
jgi:hypothetical protein